MLSRLFVSALLISFSHAALSHHSTTHFADEFTEMEGTLVELRWSNPHIYFMLETTEESGEKKLWEMEAGTIYMLGRAGITEDMFSVGDQLLVAGNESTVYDDKFWLTNVLLPEGKEVLVVARGEPRWSDSVAGGRGAWENTGVSGGLNTSSEAGFYRVWSPAVGETSRIEGPRSNRVAQVATEEALAGQETWDPYAFDAACEIPGMPRINTDIHPLKFEEDGDNIVIIGEEFPIPRTVHMNSEVDPFTVPYSPLGYSVGRWEDENTLVIHTSRIDYKYLDLSGILQSKEVTVDERYVYYEAENRVDYLVVVNDPIMLNEPYVRSGVWFDLGDVIDEFDCVPTIANN